MKKTLAVIITIVLVIASVLMLYVIVKATVNQYNNESQRTIPEININGELPYIVCYPIPLNNTYGYACYLNKNYPLNKIP